MRRAQGRPDSVGTGLSQGMAAVGEGFMAGLTGMVEKPMEAAKDGGAAGFFQGIGQGLLGAFTKPTAGFLELGSKVTEGTFAQVRAPSDAPARTPWSPDLVAPDKRGECGAVCACSYPPTPLMCDVRVAVGRCAGQGGGAGAT